MKSKVRKIENQGKMYERKKIDKTSAIFKWKYIKNVM